MTYQELLQKEEEIFGKRKESHIQDIFERPDLSKETKEKAAKEYLEGALSAIFPKTSIADTKFSNRPVIKYVKKPA